MKHVFAAVAVVAMSGAASAATLDFSSLGSGTVAGTAHSVAGADITSSGDAVYVFGDTSRICALNSGPFNCAADLGVDFTDDVVNVSVTSNGYNSGDQVNLMVYDAADALISTLAITSNMTFDLSGLGTIGRLFFDDVGGGSGLSFSQISFDVAEVPLPAGLPLLLGGLALLGINRRKKA